MANMTSSEDEAAQQLIAESHASARKAPQIPSAVQSAHLLNAARLNPLDRRRTSSKPPSSPTSYASHRIDLSSTAGMVRQRASGKLKPVGFLRDDLAKRPRQNYARRGNPFELELSSPEKAPAKAPPKPPKKAKSGAHHAAAVNPVELGASVGVLDTNPVQEELPLAFSPPPAKGKTHPEKALKVTSKASGQLTGEVADIPQNSLAMLPGHSRRGPKRKATEPPPGRQRQSKSSRNDADDIADENKAEAVLAKMARRSVQPKVVIPVSKAKQNARAETTKQAKSLPLSMNVVSDLVESRDVDIEQQARDGQQELDRGIGESRDEEPPDSGQKPQQDQEPEQESEPAKQFKGRRVRKLIRKKVLNGLDIPSAEEGTDVERPGRTKRSKQVLAPQEPEQPKPRRGRKPNAKKRPDDLDISSIHELDSLTLEPSVPAKQTRSKTRNATPAHVGSNASRPNKVKPRRLQADASAQHGRKIAEGLEDVIDLGENDIIANHQSSMDEAVDPDDDVDAGVGNGVPDTDNVAEPNGEEEPQSQIQDSEDEEYLPDIDKVIKFIDAKQRTGKCQADQAVKIKRACKAACELIADFDVSLEEVSKTTNDLLHMLAEYGTDGDEAQLRSLKIDAYGYLFRHAVIYLSLLRDWLREQYGDLESSLDAMRIFVPLVSGILSFKDRIANWKIRIPTRNKDDRLIKDVDSKLIVPLRKVEETYRTALRGLKDEARKKRAQEEASRRYRERAEAERRKQDAEALRVKKLDHWVDLHVCRLEAEPDIRRRELLRFRQEYFDTKMASWSDSHGERREERDANGLQFERVHLFKKRVVPPAHPPSDVEKEWTDEQIEALIDGLMQFAGPYVFPEIFRKYCRPKGPLRRFGVPEITAKAAEVRSRLLAKFQEQDWKEVPDWIRKIPLLP